MSQQLVSRSTHETIKKNGEKRASNATAIYESCNQLKAGNSHVEVRARCRRLLLKISAR